MSQPVIFVIDDNAGVTPALREDLDQRFGEDFRFYGVGGAEAQAMEGREVFVVGAGNSSGQTALRLARYAWCTSTWPPNIRMNLRWRSGRQPEESHRFKIGWEAASPPPCRFLSHAGSGV